MLFGCLVLLDIVVRKRSPGVLVFPARSLPYEVFNKLKKCLCLFLFFNLRFVLFGKVVLVNDKFQPIGENTASVGIVKGCLYDCNKSVQFLILCGKMDFELLFLIVHQTKIRDNDPLSLPVPIFGGNENICFSLLIDASVFKPYPDFLLWVCVGFCR
ncbi:hypothetical protein Barb6_02361 [Bacteroidales bacterium Barb6]|nr:hypothetical protein Barb6_02361 [Bacteroidales bacterium Barb6]